MTLTKKNTPCSSEKSGHVSDILKKKKKVSCCVILSGASIVVCKIEPKVKGVLFKNTF